MGPSSLRRLKGAPALCSGMAGLSRSGHGDHTGLISMAIAPRSYTAALTVLVFLNRKPPIVHGYDSLWGRAINEGLVVC